MSEAITKETAEHYLRDISPMWRAFWFHMHLYAKNLVEFSAGLEEIENGIYLYHAEGHKNDFSRWIREVVGDGALADKLEKVRTRVEATEVTKRRVAELQKIVGG